MYRPLADIYTTSYIIPTTLFIQIRICCAFVEERVSLSMLQKFGEYSALMMTNRYCQALAREAQY